MDESNMNSIVFLDYIQQESGSASVWFDSSTVRAWGLEILSKKNKDKSERKDRNKSTGGKIERILKLPMINFHKLIYSLPKREGGGTDFINMV